jgi:hypothetical protein
MNATKSYEEIIDFIAPQVQLRRLWSRSVLPIASSNASESWSSAPKTAASRPKTNLNSKTTCSLSTS